MKFETGAQSSPLETTDGSLNTQSAKFEEFKRLQAEVKELNEKYQLEVEEIQKSIYWNQLEAATKRLRKLEEELDTWKDDGSSKPESPDDDFEAKKNRYEELKKKIDELNEKFKVETDESEKSIYLSEIQIIIREIRKLEIELNITTRWPEAKPKRARKSSGKPRKPRVKKTPPEEGPETKEGSEDKEGWYISDLEPKPESPTEEKPEEVIIEDRKESKEIIPPEPQPVEYTRLTAVDVSNQVELLSRKRADERLAREMRVPDTWREKLNIRNAVRRAWMHVTEGGYRQKYMEEERNRILGRRATGRRERRSWKNLWIGHKEFERTYGNASLHQNAAASQEELKAVVERFQNDFIRNTEGETKGALTDPKYNRAITDLVREYASSDLADEEFERRKYEILQNISRDYPDALLGNVNLTADNFLETAVEFRRLREHGEGLERLDRGLLVELGQAREAIKTKANLNWIDKVVEGVQKTPVLAETIHPTTVAFGLSIVGFLSRKPLRWLGGAVGAGAALGAMRRSKEVKTDVAMHRRERAMGIGMDEFAETPAGEKRMRTQMEEYVYEMRPATEIRDSLIVLRNELEASPSHERARALAEAIADAEARMSVDERKGIDLIQFEGETQMERGRLYLLRDLREARNYLTKAGYNGNIERMVNERIDQFEEDTQEVDKRFAHFRRKEMLTGALRGAVMGLTVGAIVQEGFAKLGDVTGLHGLRPGGRQTSLEKVWSLLSGHHEETGASVDVPMSGDNFNAHFNIPEHSSFVKDPTSGLIELKSDSGELLAKFGMDANGQLLPVYQSPNVLLDMAHGVTYQRNWGSLENLKEYMWHDMPGRHGIKDILFEGKQQQLHLDETFHNHSLTSVNLNINRMLHDLMGNINRGDTVAWDKSLDPSLSHLLSEMKDVGGNLHKHMEVHVFPTREMYAAHQGIQMGSVDKDGMLGFASHLRESLFDSHGKQLARAIEVGYRDNDGNFHVFATSVGTGTAEEPLLPVDNYSYDFKQEDPGWWGLHLPFHKRKPLEHQLEERAFEEENQPSVIRRPRQIPDDTIVFPDKRKFEGKRIEEKVKVTTRSSEAQVVPGVDSENVHPNYPEKINLEDPYSVASKIINDNLPVLRQDLSFLGKLKDRDQVEYLAEVIKKDREKYEPLRNREEVKHFIDVAYDSSKEILSKYAGSSMNALPNKKNIRFVGYYEFVAKLGRKLTGDALFTAENGEIYIRGDVFDQGINEDTIETFKHFLIHEIIHGAGANNYWRMEARNIWNNERNNIYVARRIGLKHIKKVGKIYSARGFVLNEAVTEELAIEGLRNIYDKEGREVPQTYNGYPAERRILKLLREKLNIPFSVFARAALDRKALPALARAVNGETLAKEGQNEEQVTVDRPHFLSLVMALSDYEFFRKDKTYPLTQKLIEGNPVTVDAKIKDYFPPSLLEKDGTIKKDIVEKYKLIDTTVTQAQA